MILCDAEIRAALQNGQLLIDPIPPRENLSTSAVDLRLGAEFHRWKQPRGATARVAIDPSPSDFYTSLARRYLEPFPAEPDGSIVIQPDGFLLATTLERIELPVPSRLAARVEGRSSLARLGLGIHVTAPTIHAGFRGQITLEITNQGVFAIRLRPEMRICQLVVEQLFGTPSTEMTGIFQDQTSAAGKTTE